MCTLLLALTATDSHTPIQVLSCEPQNPCRAVLLPLLPVQHWYPVRHWSGYPINLWLFVYAKNFAVMKSKNIFFFHKAEFVWIIGLSTNFTMENSRKGLQEIKNRATTWASNPTSRHTAKGNKIVISKSYLDSRVHSSSIIHTSLLWKPPKYPLTNEWINKIQLDNRILFSLKKKKNRLIGDNMDKSGKYYAKWNKTERLITCLWNLKK